MKIIFAKKQENTEVVRRCLNCGKDISDKRKGAKFCCPTCKNSYNGVDAMWASKKLY